MNSKPDIPIHKKGIFYDLQSSWEGLKKAVLALPASEAQQQLIFYIDEAMN